MEISQADRDKLRASHQKITAKDSVIGSIIEHCVQDPKRYKQVSRITKEKKVYVNHDSKPSRPKLPEIKYESVYYVEKNLRSIKEEDIQVEAELPIRIQDVQANQWLNMDTVEFDKLEWMTSKAVEAYETRLNSTTHFDKDGRAIAPTAKGADKNPQIVKLKAAEGLETKKDNDNDTHDIETLVQMLDSAYDPQVTYALSVVSKIASLANLGFYDNAFEENIHSVLIKNCLLRVRHRLDDTNETVCQSAIKCLCALVCNTRIDEVVLDRMHPVISYPPDNYDFNLWLATNEMLEKEFTIEMKDSECMEIDAIRTLVERTDLVSRFRYLLQTKIGPVAITYHECILDVLIRLARHSTTTCLKLLEIPPTGPSLLQILSSDQFLPKYNGTVTRHNRSVPFKTLKLIRILAYAIEYSRAFGAEVRQVIPRDLVQTIESYFFIDCFSLSSNVSDQLFKLHIETLRVVATLIRLNEFSGDMVSLLAMGTDKLFTSVKAFASFNASKPMDTKISFDWQYAAHLINLLQLYSQFEMKCKTESFFNKLWSTHLRPITLQWFSNLVRQQIVPNLDVSIALATALRYQKSLGDHDEMLFEILKESDTLSDRYNCKGAYYFKNLLRLAAEKSQLQNFPSENGKSRDPRCLPSYGFLNFNTSEKHTFKLNPIAATDSPYLLLDSIVSMIMDRSPGGIVDVHSFIDSIELIRYVRGVSDYTHFPKSYESQIHQSISAQFEVKTISKSLLALSLFYLESERKDELRDPKLKELKSNRRECFGNLCYYVISLIGLLDIDSTVSIEIQTRLLDKILLNYQLQSLVHNESYRSRSTSGSVDCLPVDYAGEPVECRMSENRLRAISPVYLGCAPSDRFWLYQPLIHYFKTHQKVQARDCDTQEMKDILKSKRKNERWFLKISDRSNATCDIDCMSDIEIVSSMLHFIYQMMRSSPSYCKLGIQPNFEDHLCLIGSIFLDDNLFLEQEVSAMMVHNIRFMLKECGQTANSDEPIQAPFRDASLTIMSLDITLADYFNKLLDQFESASYCDLAFSNFLMLFLTPDCDKTFKLKLLQEKQETCMVFLGRLGGDSIWIPRQLFTQRKETDPEIKALLARVAPYFRQNSFLNTFVKYQTH